MQTRLDTRVLTNLVSTLKVDFRAFRRYNYSRAEVAQLVEQRTENSRLGMLSCAIRYKLGLLC